MSAGDAPFPETQMLDYCDALLAGTSTLPEIEPGVPETITWLSEHDVADWPSPEFVARTRARFATGGPARPPRIDLAQSALRPSAPRPAAPIGETHRWRVLGWAIAAVICVSLGLAYVFGGGSLPGGLTERGGNEPTIPVVAPPTGPPATPEATPAASAIASTSPVARSMSPAESTMLLANPARLGDAEAVGPGENLAIAWSFETGSRMWSSPVVAGAMLYIGNGDGQLVALDASDGGLVWQTDIGGAIHCCTSTSGGRIVRAGSVQDLRYSDWRPAGQDRFSPDRAEL